MQAGLGEAEVIENFLRQNVEDQFHLMPELLDEARHNVMVDKFQLFLDVLPGHLFETLALVFLQLLLQLERNVLLVVFSNSHNFFAIQVQRFLQAFL